MLESDMGVFRPLGFGFSGSEAARKTVTDIASLVAGIGAVRIGPSGGGSDIGPTVRAAKIPSMSLDVDDSTYFTIHHTPADTIDKIDPTDLARSVAAMAVMAYVVAEMPDRLAR
jgi:carboxypeptidase Q